MFLIHLVKFLSIYLKDIENYLSQALNLGSIFLEWAHPGNFFKLSPSHMYVHMYSHYVSIIWWSIKLSVLLFLRTYMLIANIMLIFLYKFQNRFWYNKIKQFSSRFRLYLKFHSVSIFPQSNIILFYISYCACMKLFSFRIMKSHLK